MASLLNMSGGSLLKKGLPYDAEIEYLESTGTQWIDTGIKPGVFPFSCTFYSDYKIAGGFGNAFGSRIASSNAELQITLYFSGCVSVGVRNTYMRFYKDVLNTVEFDGISTVTINGEEKTIRTKSFPEEIGNIILFGISQGSTTAVTQCSDIRIYRCKFSNLRDFIPVRVGNVGYMYDKVSGQLFGNSGSGYFILGPDKTN